ncbi:restriction endonuclease [Aeromicrobium sp. IC_218]|uniref:restriction endonuclease n=1 Tax=Aeromicrobium sp. IC_218 TaxID=2545468 RepID=UPI001038E71C|nr:restriction endonuclease [Aeromicrobium sp. IC_218]TCI99496.1 restriction endonuclease [Aeromicrobium sp. IC_218]
MVSFERRVERIKASVPGTKWEARDRWITSLSSVSLLTLESPCARVYRPGLPEIVFLNARIFLTQEALHVVSERGARYDIELRYESPRVAAVGFHPHELPGLRDGRTGVVTLEQLLTQRQALAANSRRGWEAVIDVLYPEHVERAMALGAALDQQREDLGLWFENGHPTDPIRAGGPPPGRRLVRDALEAEYLAADWVRWMGWQNAIVTPPSGDGGLDVIGYAAGEPDVAAQVKFEAKPVGRPTVQALYGASVGAGCRHHMVFSSAGYTRGAVEWAAQTRIALFRFSFDGGIEPLNDLANSYLH